MSATTPAPNCIWSRTTSGHRIRNTLDKGTLIPWIENLMLDICAVSFLAPLDSSNQMIVKKKFSESSFFPVHLTFMEWERKVKNDCCTLCVVLFWFCKMAYRLWFFSISFSMHIRCEYSHSKHSCSYWKKSANNQLKHLYLRRFLTLLLSFALTPHWKTAFSSLFYPSHREQHLANKCTHFFSFA